MRRLLAVIVVSLLSVWVTQPVAASDMRGQLFYTLNDNIYTWNGDAHNLVLEGEPYSGYGGLLLSPDGATLAFFKDEYRAKLYLMDVATGEVTALPDELENVDSDFPQDADAHHRQPVFSPDGTQIAYWESFSASPRRIRVHDIASGETRTLADSLDGNWLPTGFLDSQAHPPFPSLHWGAQISYTTIDDVYGNRTLRMFDPETGDYSEYQYSQENARIAFHGWRQMSDGAWLVHLSADDDTAQYLLDPLAGDWFQLDDSTQLDNMRRLVDEPDDALRVRVNRSEGEATTLTVITPDDTHTLDASRYAIRPDGQALAVVTHIEEPTGEDARLVRPNVYLWQPDDGYTLLREIEDLPRAGFTPPTEIVWGATKMTFLADPAMTAVERPFVLGETGIPETPAKFSDVITLQLHDVIDIDTGEITNRDTSDAAIELARKYGREWWKPIELWFREDDAGERMVSTLPPMYPFANGTADESRSPRDCPIFSIAGEFRTDFKLDNLLPEEVYCFVTSEGNPGYFYLVTDTRNRDLDSIDELRIHVHIWESDD